MKSDIKWYVLRVRYGQGLKASITLKESGFEIYYPPHKYRKWVDGRLRTIVEPPSSQFHLCSLIHKGTKHHFR